MFDKGVRQIGGRQIGDEALESSKCLVSLFADVSFCSFVGDKRVP
jgi:hypothetical protein